MVVLDTNIIIDHLRLQQKQKDSHLMKIAKQKPKEVLALSLVSTQELYEGQSTKNAQEVAQLAGEIARDLDRPIELADAAIAATVILNGSSLLTLNKEDFTGIKNLLIFE